MPSRPPAPSMSASSSRPPPSMPAPPQVPHQPYLHQNLLFGVHPCLAMTQRAGSSSANWRRHVWSKTTSLTRASSPSRTAGTRSQTARNGSQKNQTGRANSGLERTIGGEVDYIIIHQPLLIPFQIQCQYDGLMPLCIFGFYITRIRIFRPEYQRAYENCDSNISSHTKKAVFYLRIPLKLFLGSSECSSHFSLSDSIKFSGSFPSVSFSSPQISIPFVNFLVFIIISTLIAAQILLPNLLPALPPPQVHDGSRPRWHRIADT